MMRAAQGTALRRLRSPRARLAAAGLACAAAAAAAAPVADAAGSAVAVYPRAQGLAASGAYDVRVRVPGGPWRDAGAIEALVSRNDPSTAALALFCLAEGFDRSVYFGVGLVAAILTWVNGLVYARFFAHRP